MGFGDQLRKVREAVGLSQQELANKAGISIDSIQNWEQGRTQPRLPALGKLAVVLSVSLDVLVIEGNDKPEAKRNRGRPKKSSPPPAEESAPKKRRKK